jgi:hypothetical protein
MDKGEDDGELAQNPMSHHESFALQSKLAPWKGSVNGPEVLVFRLRNSRSEVVNLWKMPCAEAAEGRDWEDLGFRS